VKRKNGRKKTAFWAVFLVLLFALIAASGYRLWKAAGTAAPGVPSPVPKSMTSPPAVEPPGPPPAPEEAAKPAAPAPGTRWENRIALVIDDIGYDPEVARDLADLPVPVAFGILPQCPHSTEAARLAREGKKEILLHLPMEPRGFPEADPGPGAVFRFMTAEEITARVGEDLESVPGAIGVNNHMGSSFMEDGDRLAVVFRCLKERRLFFLDSLTTAKSEAAGTAGRLGVPCVARDIFLDNGNSPEGTREVFQGLLEKRERWRELVVIGHPYRNTVEVLREMIPKLEKAGIRFVPLSSVVK
jgi:polysaccharide deacetylase 2 family uncharacterized protein YibQ